jgi:integrase
MEYDSSLVDGAAWAKPADLNVPIPLPSLERTREIRFLTPVELAELAAAMPAEYRAMVYLAGVLGLRWSEVVGLRVGR